MEKVPITKSSENSTWWMQISVITEQKLSGMKCHLPSCYGCNSRGWLRIFDYSSSWWKCGLVYKIAPRFQNSWMRAVQEPELIWWEKEDQNHVSSSIPICYTCWTYPWMRKKRINFQTFPMLLATIASDVQKKRIDEFQNTQTCFHRLTLMQHWHETS